jgi:hypothetical protein
VALFVLWCVIVALAVITWLCTFAVSRPAPRRRTRVAAVAAFTIATVAFLLPSTFTVVSTKNLAVLTVAGRPDGELDNGFHWKQPWQHPTEIDDAIQTDVYASDQQNLGVAQGGATDTCIHVRVAGQIEACANVAIRWQIRPSGVDYLFRNFRDFVNIQDNLVLRDLQQAMNEALSSFNPLLVDQNGNAAGEPLSTTAQDAKSYSHDVAAIMQRDIGRWIAVPRNGVIISFLNYDQKVNEKISEVQSQVARTIIAEQSIKTNADQARANEELSKSVSHDPNVLVAQCLNMVQNAIDKGATLPAGFNCDLLGQSSTSGVSIAVPGK